MSTPNRIDHVLLDIEGTTCPVSFVADVLFPYASAQLLPFLRQHQGQEPIQRLIKELQGVWNNDSEMEAVAMRTGSGEDLDQFNLEALCCYLQWLIRTDRKVTPLKDLQGMIWEEGYQQGNLIAPLFEDVPDALKRWQASGVKLSVYSSGSIKAQKLLYQHTNSGDLSHLFSEWFDTRTGAKDQPASYEKITVSLGTIPERILFISDSVSELRAALQAQLSVLFSNRPGNPDRDSQGFPNLRDFSELNPTKF